MLKIGREQRQLSRKQLAELIGANVNSIAKYEKAGEENGQYPPLPVLARLTSELNLSPARIFAEVAENPKDKEKFLTGWLRPLSAITTAFYSFEEIWAGMDAALHEIREDLTTKMPITGMKREEFRELLNRSFPEKDSRPAIIEEFYFDDEKED